MSIPIAGVAQQDVRFVSLDQLIQEMGERSNCMVVGVLTDEGEAQFAVSGNLRDAGKLARELLTQIEDNGAKKGFS